MSVRILIICREGDAQQKYLDECKELGAQIDTVSMLEEFYQAVTYTPYNGLMIDMPTKLKVFGEEKEKVNNILQQYPVIQLTFQEKSGQIRAFYSGLVKGNGTIKDFITRECLSFGARTIRSNHRRNITFNVILSKSKNVSNADHERSVTTNVSRGGCFIYSTDNWEVNSDAWFIIKELTDQTHIWGHVCRKVDWGKHMCVPGIGLQFKDIKESQLDEICTKSHI